MRIPRTLLLLLILIATFSSCRKSSPDEIYIIRTDSIDEIRHQISSYKANHPISESHKGWSISSDRDPMALVRLFPSLKLASGYKLCMYQWLDSLGGFAKVYAIKSDDQLPSPDPKSTRKNPGANIMSQDLIPDNPAPNLDSYKFQFMDAIQGNDSPQSYLLASILMFEIDEIGAYWHGREWDDTFILSGKPEDHRYLSHGIIRPTQNMEVMRSKLKENDNNIPCAITWNYTHPWPLYWEPYVVVSKYWVNVHFVSYTGRNDCKLVITNIEFERGKYKPISVSTERLAIGNGPSFEY